MHNFTKQKILKVLFVSITILLLGFYFNSKQLNERKTNLSNSDTVKGETLLTKIESSNKDEQTNKITEEKSDGKLPKTSAQVQKKEFRKTTATKKQSTVNAISSDKEKSKSVQNSKDDTLNNNIYHDGVYYGSSEGRNGAIDVEVIVSEGKIDSIQVISHNDTKNLFDLVYQNITKAVYEKQSPNVDIVSGATLSSTGLINAIKSALEKAIK